MDTWEEKPYRSHRHQRETNPSFSSTLLDVIYRSIDESNSTEVDQEELVFYRETMRKKHSSSAVKQDGRSEVERACMIEKWMEKKVTSHEKVDVRRKSMADFDKNPPRKELDSVLLNSCSSSSESSCGGGFSSSESESFYGLNSRSPTHTMQIRPKPIRTSISARPAAGKHQRPMGEIDTDHRHHHHHHHHHRPQKPKHEGGFNKAKTKALKIYGDLKKVKQPLSPGGRLASFLNSIFTSGNAKKAKLSSSSSGYQDSSKLKLSEQQAASTCSSASSFSRSCLSKTPSSRGKLSNGTKRSVRFYPVSVIVDEDCRPCGHKNLYGSEESLRAIPTTRNPTNDELKFRIPNENRRVEEVAKDLLKNYQIRKKQEFDMRDACNGNEGSSESEEEDDDAASYASSDLFELDNLSAIGFDRYREELPVYETTYLGTNRAIASGLIL